MSVRVSLGGLGRSLRGIGRRLPPVMHTALVDAAMQIRARVEVEIAATTVRGQSRQPVDVGVYAAGWRAQRTPTGAVVGNAVPHAVWIEIGRRPGPVSVEAIAQWVRRKGLHLSLMPQALRKAKASSPKGTSRKQLKVQAEDAAVKSLAFAISKKLAAEGYEPRHVLRRAVVNSRGQVRNVLRRALKGIRP